jgi:hypothetical protein
MKVKIISHRYNPDVWYTNRIGQIFNVKVDPSEGLGYYKVKYFKLRGFPDGLWIAPDDCIEVVDAKVEWKLQTFRSGGLGVNCTDNMGRVYMDLPIIKAKKLLRKLSNSF